MRRLAAAKMQHSFRFAT